MKYTVLYCATPNPQSMRFYWGPEVGSPVFFETLQSATRSPLAHKLFGFPWMKAALVGQEFVTITKHDWVEWKILAEPLCDLIGEHLERGEAIMNPEPVNNTDQENNNPLVLRIKQLLDEVIRPAVQMDGGEIVFDRFDNGTLYISMQGACSGCPSSQITLKQGIEAQVRERIPEVKEVVAV